MKFPSFRRRFELQCKSIKMVSFSTKSLNKKAKLKRGICQVLSQCIWSIQYSKDVGHISMAAVYQLAIRKRIAVGFSLRRKCRVLLIQSYKNRNIIQRLRWEQYHPENNYRLASGSRSIKRFVIGNNIGIWSNAGSNFRNFLLEYWSDHYISLICKYLGFALSRFVNILIDV